MEIVLLDLAPKALELADDISLRTMNSIRPWRARSDFDQSAHVFVSSGSVEATSSRRVRCRRKIRRLCHCWVVHSRAVYASWLAIASDTAQERQVRKDDPTSAHLEPPGALH